MTLDELVEEIERSIHPDKVGTLRNRQDVKDAIEAWAINQFNQAKDIYLAEKQLTPKPKEKS